ncbi:MAG: outer membrane lipoprotein-sorting protein [Candidatus Bipolaricaulota bacterium]|nr:outer membrane lipoprotein-sorting protein [Candidatus Bipolaricaulota bacterium]MCS7275282.1 outer membrane lipoprotein-sorting protein [Candidatus Bipolaricaulota bacterium]MDW8111538.1 outer membrane lipoprotein-sorting protein [Candidatus Bipolaricaulota bacterium]MDW8329426.1 outer membrane lipoprotein-sorting protein [Candidatus Bipolaricaulota bacterium]
MRTVTKLLGLGIGLALLLGVWSLYGQPALTGPQILQRVEEKGGIGGLEGELISDVKFEILGKDKKTATNEFRFFSKRKKGEPDRLLVAFVKPDDVRGTLFLSIKPQGKEADLWLYLPALGAVKQLVNTQERKGSFAGSNLSFEDLGGGFKYSEDYNVDERVTEEKLKVGDKEYTAYVLTLRVKREKERTEDYPVRKMWVEKSEFVVLKGEAYNKTNKLESVFEALTLGRFENETVPDRVLIKNVLDGSQTTISFLTRKRPSQPLSESLFDPNNLKNLKLDDLLKL